MANVAFSDLSAITTPADDDLLCMTDDSESVGDKSKKITYKNFYTHLLSLSNCHRAQFDYSSTSAVLIGAAKYHHVGTTDQLVYWNSQLTYTFSNLAASDWSYLYIDDSAVVSAGTNLLTASEFIDSTTPPTWNGSNHGWYNGDDLCIFAVATNSSSEILEFFHASDFVCFADRLQSRTIADLDSTWTDVSLNVPDFGIDVMAQCTFYVHASGDADTVVLFWRTDGQTGTTGHRVALCDDDRTRFQMNTANVISAYDSGSGYQRIEIKFDTGGAHKAAVYTDGWYLPVGM